MKILTKSGPGASVTKLLAVAVLAVAGASCYPGDILNVQDADVVITAYDESFSFTGARTYAMPDSVVAVDLDASNNQYDHSLDAMVLQTVAANMTAAGYARTENPEDLGADLIVLVYANVSNNFVAYTWYPYDTYYGWYGGWNYWGGYPGYGGSYPWYGAYPPQTTVGNIKTGSFVIEIIDPNAQGPTDDGPSLPVRWGAILMGLAQGNAGAARVERAIDQAFDQSPYLAN